MFVSSMMRSQEEEGNLTHCVLSRLGHGLALPVVEVGRELGEPLRTRRDVCVSHNGREAVVVKENKEVVVGTVGSMTVTSRMKFLVVETTSEYTTQAGVVLKSIDDG